MKEKNNEKLDSERERVRKQGRKQGTFSAILGIVLILVLIALGYLLVDEIMKIVNEKKEINNKEEVAGTVIEMKIVDDNQSEQISSRVKEYVSLIEKDLKDLGFKPLRAVLPAGKMRELDIDIEGVTPYFKVTIDRDAAVTAEDISRMIKYLKENNIEPTYVDVRVDGKAFYK